MDMIDIKTSLPIFLNTVIHLRMKEVIQKLDQTPKTHKMEIMIHTQAIITHPEEQMVFINEVITMAGMKTMVCSIVSHIRMDQIPTREMKEKSTERTIETEGIEGIEMKESDTETIEIVEMTKMTIVGTEGQIETELRRKIDINAPGLTQWSQANQVLLTTTKAQEETEMREGQSTNIGVVHIMEHQLTRHLHPEATKKTPDYYQLTLMSNDLIVCLFACSLHVT